MFFRRLFKIDNKTKWIFIELFAIFFGVYLAFLLQNYSENIKISKEREKVLVSLKLELESFRTGFPGFAEYQLGKTKEWDSLLSENQALEYYSWRYLEPQYNFRVIEYALNQKGTDIINFSLYEELSHLFGRIKQLEHAERLMTEFAGRHKLILSSFKKDDPIYLERSADNRFNFFKFISFAKDRAGAMAAIADESAITLERINTELGAEKVREVEIGMLKKYYKSGTSVERLWGLCLKFFPKYSRAEFDQMIEEVKQD